MKLLLTIQFLLLLFLLTCHSSVAQKKNDQIGISFGGSNFHITDDHTSPLIFRGTGIAPSINWQHIGKRNSQYAEGSFSFANLSSSTDNFRTENFRGRFRYSFLHKSSDSIIADKGFEFSYGGSVTSFYCKSDYFFDLRTTRGRAIESWYLSQSIDMSLQLNYFFSDKNYLGLQIFSPLISSVSRPFYSPSGGYDYAENDWIIKPIGRIELFPKNFSVNINLIYQVPVSTNLGIRINWEFYFMKYSVPDDISMYMNNFRIGVFYFLNKKS